MFSLIRFADNSHGIYNKKKISCINENLCVVKHNGCKHEGQLLRSSDTINDLQTYQETVSTQVKLVSTDRIKDKKSEVLPLPEENNCLQNGEPSSPQNDCSSDFDDFLFGNETLQNTSKALENFDEVIFSISNFSENGNSSSSDLCVAEYEDNSDDDPNYSPSNRSEREEENISNYSERTPEYDKDSDSNNDYSGVMSGKGESNPFDNGTDDVTKIIAVPSDSKNMSGNRDFTTLQSRTRNIPHTSQQVASRFSVSFTEKHGCDDTNMLVMPSRGRAGDKKINFCFYCHTKQKKIARHLESKHKDEDEVKRFIYLPKGNPERREIIGNIRKKGNFLFNTEENFNDGELIVSRRPRVTASKNARDFRACGKCKAFFSKTSLRIHFSKCTGLSSRKRRLAEIISKKVTARIHKKASNTVSQYLFPPFREDNIVRFLRHDELLITYANKMCQKYRDLRFHEMIRHRLRLLGRFYMAIREINPDISDFSSIYDPRFIDDTSKAINVVAKFDELSNMYKTPSVAFSLGTLIKQVGGIFVTECIKNHLEESE